MSRNPDIAEAIGTEAGGGTHHWVSVTELRAIREKLREAQETLDAIQSGEVDAVVVSGSQGSQIYTLSGAEEPYRIYVEQMQEGAMTASESGMILYSNKKFSELVGLPLEKVISSQVTECLEDGVWESITGGMAVDQVVKLETVLQGDGTPVPVMITANKLATVEDPLICMVITDLTAQKERQEMAVAKEVAEAANLAKDSFLAVLSHELRTPLTPALMAASLLERDPSLSEKARELAVMIRRNVEIETRLIEDLLDLTRITQGKIQLLKQDVELHRIIRDAVRVCQPDLEDQSQSVELDLSAAKSTIVGDAVRLQQIFWNLIRNSSKFSGRKKNIRICSWNTPEGMLRISVADEGVGIEPDLLPKLFTPFEQGGEEMTKRFGGLGLGLVICKSIAELHEGGSIEASSEGKNKGSCFTLTFQPIDHEANPPRHSAVRSRGRVLLVEDNADSRVAVTMLLELLNFSVESVATIENALRSANRRPFDVVVSDIGLPDGNGYTLMRELREKHELRGIAMSGFGQPEDVERAKAAGFDIHLVKPVSASALEEALLSVFETNAAQG